jgi:hypothetical protein
MRGQTITAEMSADAARMTDFDPFIIPGGHAPDIKVDLR